MNKKFIIIVACLLSFSYIAKTQDDIKTKGKGWFNLSAEYAYCFPQKDLKERYGNSLSVGGSAIWKTDNNFLISLTGTYLFGDNVKNKNEVLSIINNDKGDIIDGNGEIAEVRYFERGMSWFLKVGKILPIAQINKNSGPTISIGPGFFQHKTKIDNPENIAPQIVGEYKKGYDRLTNGFALNQFVGYTVFSDNRIYNYFLGVEFTQAWTEAKRYDFNLMGKDQTTRFDAMWSIKFGWIIHFRKRVAGRIYF